MSDAAARRTWIPIPGMRLALLGPDEAHAVVAVEPFVPFDRPTACIQSFIAGICGANNELLQPVEIEMVVDETTVTRDSFIRRQAVLQCFERALPDRQQMPARMNARWVRESLDAPERLRPLLFCRRSSRLFFARSALTGEQLTRPVNDDFVIRGDELCTELVVGATRDEESQWFAGAGGESNQGAIESLDRLLMSQPQVAAMERPNSVRPEDWVCTCEQCQTPETGEDAYSPALDRLVFAHCADTPLCITPLGEWSWTEAGQIIGGAEPTSLTTEEPDDDAFQRYRRERAQQMEQHAPARVFLHESDGRELLESLRYKLGLISDALDQLVASWRVTGGPHLCWNENTLRVGWRPTASAPCLGAEFDVLLRRVGLQPFADAPTPTGGRLRHPPEFSDAQYLAPETQHALRYFNESRQGTVFIKKESPFGERRGVMILLEDSGLKWDGFCPDDALVAYGDGWQAVLRPCGERDERNDGEGLPFEGYVEDPQSSVKSGEEIRDCEFRWYPRFGEAVDLHALGMLSWEMLLATDERTRDAVIEAFNAQRADLTQQALAVPEDQREALVHSLLVERCATDAPASVWTRRNLLFARALRSGASLDAFPSVAWQVVVAHLIRWVTHIPGVSYCADRAQDVPRASEELTLPQIELRGVISLVDDYLYMRNAPGHAVRERFVEEGS